MAILSVLGRGALAGAGGGAIAAGFGYAVAEPVIDRAIALETAGHHHAEAEIFTRDTQHLGLLVGLVATGVAVGVLFALVYAVLHRDDPVADAWRRPVRLAGAGFLAFFLLPYLRYPANPPGVGDPATAGLRTRLWLAAIAIGVVTVALAAAAVRRLADRPEPVRHLAAVAVGVAGLGALFLLPGNPDPVDVPAALLSDFRLLSVATMLLLWGGLGVGFGLLGGYAARRAVPQPATT